MIVFDHDPEEVVRLGASDLTLRDAIKKVSTLSPRPHLVDIFREFGREPSVLGWDEIDWLASLPAYAIDEIAQGVGAVRTFFRLPGVPDEVIAAEVANALKYARLQSPTVENMKYSLSSFLNRHSTDNLLDMNDCGRLAQAILELARITRL